MYTHVLHLNKCLSNDTLVVTHDGMQVTSNHGLAKNQLKHGPRGQKAQTQQDPYDQNSLELKNVGRSSCGNVKIR